MAIDTNSLVYLIDPFWQGENINGKPLVGGYMTVFYAGTDIKYITYQNFDGARHPFKIPLNNDGRATILVEPNHAYDCYLYDSFGNLACSRLNVRPVVGGDISISGGIYDGIEPIVVNNDVNLISANHVPLGVQDPLYFVQDDEEGCIIGISGGTGPVPEGTMNESAFGYENGQIISYNGSAFAEGASYEAGSYIDIDGNTINVTGVQSAGDYVVYDDLSAYATEDWVEQQSYMKEYMESAFYPMTSNPSGYINDVSNLATKDELSAYTERSAFNAAIESINSGKLDVSSFSSVSSDFLQSADLAGYATENWVTGQGYITNDAITGKQDITGMTAYQAAGEYYSATNPSGFITGVDLTPYQTTAGMTAYQPSGDYLTTGDSANFYTTANESGFITGVDLAPYQTTAGMTAYQTTAGMSNYATTGDLDYVSGVVGNVESLLASL